MINCHFLLLLLVDDDAIFVGGAYIDLDASLEAFLGKRLGFMKIDEDKSLPLQLRNLSIERVGPANLLVLLVGVVLLFHKRTIDFT